MIKLNDVTFRYGNEQDPNQTGVKHIQLSVQVGQCAILCGRSGCGKSTLMRLINGLAPTFYPGKLVGDIRVGDKIPASLLPEERTKLLGVVFQDPRSQFFMHNVRDELAFSAENLGITSAEIVHRIQVQTKRLGISNLLDRSLHHLSSGQKQLVAIAAASILSPPLLLLDEPTANLDAKATEALLDILSRLKQNGTTLLISEHRLHALLPIADCFVCMEKGTIARIWTKTEFAQLAYEDIRPYGLRHPEMAPITVPHPFVTSPLAEPILEGKQLTYHYKRTGNGFSQLMITLLRGNVTTLMGDNGTGKTTLGKVLCGLLRQQKGTLSKQGLVLSSARRRALSYLVMQDADYQLYTDSVGNEMIFGRRLNDTLRAKAYAALDLFDIRTLRHRHPASLSGGEKQRVTMAAAYCSDAEIIVLDEPTSGLDGDGVLQVITWVKQLAQLGKAIVMITHDQLLTNLASDYVIELKMKQERVDILEK